MSEQKPFQKGESYKDKLQNKSLSHRLRLAPSRLTVLEREKSKTYDPDMNTRVAQEISMEDSKVQNQSITASEHSQKCIKSNDSASISTLEFNPLITPNDLNRIDQTRELHRQNMKVELIEKKLEQQRLDMRKLKQTIKTMEDKIEDYTDHLNNRSPDPHLATTMYDKQSDLRTDLEQLEINMQQYKDMMEKLNTAKDKAFDMIRDIHIEMDVVEERVEEQDRYILRNRESISVLTEHVQDKKREHKFILSKLETHDIKLNAANVLPSKPWVLQSDFDQYPILRLYQNQMLFNQLPTLLKTISLTGDSITNVKQFYNNINMALMTSVSVMKFFSTYEYLTIQFDPKTHIVPPSNHPQHDDANNAYIQYSHVMSLHLQEPTIIQAAHAPRALVLRQEVTTEDNGFQAFFYIIKNLSPQLRGSYRDLQNFVNTLTIIEGEPVLNCYLRAHCMSVEIKLQKDNTGQQNRLIQRFIAQLFNVQAFTECMYSTMKHITLLFEDPNNHLKKFPRSLKDIYDNDIKANCAPTFISAKSKYKQPIQPQIAQVHVDPQDRDSNNHARNEKQLQQPRVNTARLTRASSQQTQPSFVKKRLACNKTQKEIHECLRHVHDPSDPSKCCFRGVKFMSDKDMRTALMTYNAANHGGSNNVERKIDTLTTPQ